jgi:hypothetical protein
MQSTGFEPKTSLSTHTYGLKVPTWSEDNNNNQALVPKILGDHWYFLLVCLILKLVFFNFLIGCLINFIIFYLFLLVSN